jgi:hypothetical protein
VTEGRPGVDMCRQRERKIGAAPFRFPVSIPGRTSVALCLTLLSMVSAGCAVGRYEVLHVTCERDAPSNPTFYSSASKAFCLEVIPRGKPYAGREDTEYRMTRNGVRLWSHSRSYVTTAVAVTDAGVVVGVASEARPNGNELLHMIVIDGGGRQVLDWQEEQQIPEFLSQPPPRLRPYPVELLIDCRNDRLIAVVCEPGGLLGKAALWSFRLSTGDVLPRVDVGEMLMRLGHFVPDTVDQYGGFPVVVLEIQAVLDTPLLLLHCAAARQAKSASGNAELDSIFVLLDDDSKPVWHVEADRNVTLSSQGVSPGSGPGVCPPGPLLFAHKPGCFGVFLRSQNAVATYTVKRSQTEGWSVTETGRTTLAKTYREHGVESQPCP